jgi:hypothetical protein
MTMRLLISAAAAGLLLAAPVHAQTVPPEQDPVTAPQRDRTRDRIHDQDQTGTADRDRTRDRIHDQTGTADRDRARDRIHDQTGTADRDRTRDRTHTVDGARAAHEAMHEALRQRATLPEQAPAVPGHAGPDAARRETTRIRTEAAEQIATRHAERNRSSAGTSPGASGQRGAGAGAAGSGAQEGTGRMGGDCQDAAGMWRTRERQGGLAPGDGGGGGAR